jgi:site-specific recombinase XerC
MKETTEKGTETDMNTIAQRIATAPAADVETMAIHISREAPTLAELNQAQLEQIARLVITQRLADELKQKVDIVGVDWKEERKTFLGDAKSPHTRRAYATALNRLETWAARQGINLLSMAPAQADSFIRALKEEGRAPASTRRDIAAVSAFFTFLERYHAAVKNPIRGTRIRPANENRKEAIIPTTKEYKTMVAVLPAIERAILATLALRGLRAGALPTLEKRGERYQGKSKGKALTEGEVSGVILPPKVIEAITAAGLDVKKPFAWTNANAIERRINYHIGKLYQTGKVRAIFSCHDFRHFFAKKEYEKDKDILRVSRLLCHSNVSITQKYLRSIGVSL